MITSGKVSFTQRRGTKKEIQFPFIGDCSADNISFVLKRSSEILDDRLIEKNKDSELSDITYDEKQKVTIVKFTIDSVDCQDLEPGEYFYDCKNLTKNTEDYYYYGSYTFTESIQTPFDGSNLPGDGKRVILIDLNEYDEGDFLIVSQSGVSAVVNICGEEMIGVKNGENLVFTFPDGDIPIENKEQIFFNGSCFVRGVDYTIEAGEVTLLSAPYSNHYLYTNYWKIKNN